MQLALAVDRLNASWVVAYTLFFALHFDECLFLLLLLLLATGFLHTAGACRH
jgi:hypothetical protein